MRKMLLICLLGITSLATQASTSCHPVGGTILTNFVDSTTTIGSATGDLAGGIGVTVLSFVPNPDGTLVFNNQHSWVTQDGDTINTDPAVAVGYPTAVAGFYAARYTKGLLITGGTGKFRGASGKLRGWGAVDTNKGEVILRYEGSVCIAHEDQQ